MEFYPNPSATDQDEPGVRPQNSKQTSPTSSPKRRLPDPEADLSGNVKSRRAVEKRVVSVPIADTEGAPPSDTWAWRKYGQKPIKGSPYPRGYYRCSSWKGCPARKQVERSFADPTMLVITYACDHNHSLPISRSNANPKSPIQTRPAVFSSPVDAAPAEKFADLKTDELLQAADDFCWLSDIASSSPAKDTLLDSPICAGGDEVAAAAAASVFPMGEEDESLFADLGELPESSAVFRRWFYGRLREAPCCGSTG